MDRRSSRLVTGSRLGLAPCLTTIPDPQPPPLCGHQLLGERLIGQLFCHCSHPQFASRSGRVPTFKFQATPARSWFRPSSPRHYLSLPVGESPQAYYLFTVHPIFVICLIVSAINFPLSPCSTSHPLLFSLVENYPTQSKITTLGVHHLTCETNCQDGVTPACKPEPFGDGRAQEPYE